MCFKESSYSKTLAKHRVLTPAQQFCLVLYSPPRAEIIRVAQK